MGKSVIRNLWLCIILLVIISASLLMSTGAVYGATDVRGNDKEQADPGNEMVLYEGTFGKINKSKVLAYINKIRKEACDKGYRDPRNPSRKLTANDYVPIKWSRDLEWIAQTRAAETSLNYSHTRPSGDSCFTANHNGQRSWNEVICATLVTSADEMVLNSVDIWWSEEYNWIHNTGGVTGHYTALINPSNTYVGISSFVPSNCLMGYGAGEFSSEDGIDESVTGEYGKRLQTIEVRSSMLAIKGAQTIKVNKGATLTARLRAISKYENALDEETQEFLNYKYTPYVYLTSATDWSSNKANIASIDSAGNIRGLREGTVNVIAKHRGKSYSATVKVLDQKAHAPGKVTIKSASKGKHKITVKFKRIAKKTKGYQVRITDKYGYEYDYNVKQSGKKTLSKVVKSVPKGTYKVKIRAYNKYDGEKYYGAWSKTKAVTVK